LTQFSTYYIAPSADDDTLHSEQDPERRDHDIASAQRHSAAIVRLERGLQEASAALPQ